MPIYEYQCQACEHHFEKIQKVSDSPLVDCPQCGKPQLQKLISAPSFRLKGSGWYETDFKTKPEKQKTTTEASDAKPKSSESGTTKTSTTTDSKE